MNVGHQPANGILREQQRDDEPMEYLRGCSVVQAIGHEVPYLGVGWRSRVRIAEIDETRDRAREFSNRTHQCWPLEASASLAKKGLSVRQYRTSIELEASWSQWNMRL